MIRDLIVRKEAAVTKFEQLVCTPDAALLETLTTATSVPQTPYSKKLPNSTYKGSKNVSSFNYQIYRQDILQRIKTYAKSAATNRKKELESGLTSCFNISVSTENAACYDHWFRLMRTLEIIDLELKADLQHDFSTDSDVKTAVYTVENVKKRFEGMGDEAKAEIEGLQLMETMEEVSRAYRLLVKKMEDKTLLRAFDDVWVLVCLLFDLSVSLNDSKISRAYIDIQRQVEEERLRIKNNLKLMTDEWQKQLETAKEQTVKAGIMIERLQKEKSFISELLKERESEINEIRKPEGVKDFENVLGELSQHLEDMESRHETQAQLLDSISELINTKPIKKHGKRKDEVGHFLVKNALAQRPESASYRASMKIMSEDKGMIAQKMMIQETGMMRVGREDSELGQEEAVRSRAYSTPQKLVKNRLEKQNPTKPIPIPRASFEFLNKGINPMIPESVIDTADVVPNEMETDHSQSSEESRDEKEVQTDFVSLQTGPMQQTTQTDFAFRSKPGKRKNELFAHLDDEMKKQPPMLSSNVFKLFEIAMIEKLKIDLFEEEQGRSPKSMSEFMLDFLFMQQGLKTLVMKSLGALLNALEVLAMKEHPYGLLFCRILNVYAEDPFDSQLTAFLVKARAGFAEIQKGYKTVSPKSEAEFGGSALLIDVSELLVNLFPSHKSIAYEIMERFSVSGFTDFDKVCTLFCGRLAKVGRDFKIFFIQADPQKSGSLDEEAFIKCAQDSFDICLSRSRLMEIYRFLTKGKLHFSDIQKLPFKDWALKAMMKNVSVSKCTFLTVIAEMYKLEESRLESQLGTCYDQKCTNGLSCLTEFKELVMGLESSMTPETAVHLYREALELSSEDSENPDFVTRSAFCEVGLKYRLGCDGLRAFTGQIPPLQTALNMDATQMFNEELD